MTPPRFASTGPYLAWHADHTPRATAIVEDALRVDYRTLAEDLVRCVHALERLDVGAGLTIGIEIRRERYLHLLLLLACEALGAGSASVTAEDLASRDPILRLCDLLLVAAEPGPGRRVIAADWLETSRATPVSAHQWRILARPVVPAQMARIVRTSGTTGRPKVMAISHAILQRVVERHMERVAEETTPVPVSLCLYNLSVRAVYARVLGFLQRGGTVLFAKEDHAPQLLAAGLVNHVMFTVGDAERVALRTSPPPPGHRLHVELVGARAAPALRALLQQRLNARISTRYSSNETNMIAATDDGDVGTICPGVDVRIVDAAGQELPLGETGVIRVRTDAMVDGYLDDPAATAAAFIDGWYHTSDAGYMPEPGRLVVLGRADDMLNIGGVKLPPAPFEEAIRQFPGVADAVLMTVGNTHDVGLLVVAVEVVGDQPPPDLAERLDRLLSGYTRTFETMPLPWFPRTETGKVKRPELKAAFLRRQQQD